MKYLSKRMLLASLLFATSLAVLAQTGSPATSASAAMSPHSGSSASMGSAVRDRIQQHLERRHVKKMNRLKNRLKLGPDQDSAWTTFSNAMQPSRQQENWLPSKELAKLGTPERIDWLLNRVTEREKLLRQRGDAIKAFYALLGAQQKEVFDKETLRASVVGGISILRDALMN